MKAIFNRIIVLPDKEPEKSRGGIFFVKKHSTEHIQDGMNKTWRGTVLSAGPGHQDPKTGRFVKNEIPEGARVIFKMYAGTEMNVDGTLYQIMCDHDVEAIEENETDTE